MTTTTSRLAPQAFSGTDTSGYLDTATCGLPPADSVAAMQAAARGWRDQADPDLWEADGEACRAAFARLIGARPDQIALVPAVSAAVGLVATGSTWRAGDNIVVFEREFQSVLIPLLPLQQRGVELRLVPLGSLHDAIDERTAMVAVSTVQSADGRTADLERLRATGVPLLLDGTQSVGSTTIDLRGVDFLAAAAYKWLLCPRGLAFLYIADRRREQLTPWLSGWKSHAHPATHDYYGPPTALAPDARRFDTSLAWHLAAGARPSLELLARLGSDTIGHHGLTLARRFARGLSLPSPMSTIVAIPSGDPWTVRARLAAAGIRCAVRDGALRFCFHLYNEDRDVDAAVGILRSGGSDA